MIDLGKLKEQQTVKKNLEDTRKNFLDGVTFERTRLEKVLEYMEIEMLKMVLTSKLPKNIVKQWGADQIEIFRLAKLGLEKEYPLEKEATETKKD